MAELKPLKGGYYLWKYIPSLPAAIIFCVLFFIITALHAWRLWKTRLWFCIPFAVGGLLQVIGYAARAQCHSATDQLGPYIIQSTLTLLPPTLYGASIYMVLGRVIRAAPGNSEHYSIVRPVWLTRVFLTGDILTLFIQSGGAGLMAGDQSMAELGPKIVVGGLVLQIVIFGIFWATAVVFHVRYERHSVSAINPAGAWVILKGILFMLYGVSALIMVRSIFRTIEFAQGLDGWLITHEWTLYVFDSVLMLGVMVVFYIWYPSGISEAANMGGCGEMIGSTDGFSAVNLDTRSVV